MSQDSTESKNPSIDPLLQAINRVGKFQIEVQANDHFSVATSHRPLVRGIKITNTGWQGDADEFVVSIHTEAPGTSSLVHPWARAYPIFEVGDSLIDDLLPLRPHLVQLCSIDEATHGDLVVQVRVNDEVLGEKRVPIDFLAYNQWFHSRLDYDSIASFVFPSHPFVARVMEGVRNRLKDNTGDGTTAGYQHFGPRLEHFSQGVERVQFIVRAIYEELQTLNLEYSDPPASFEGYGQKIRTPDVIEREKVATCLDSSVLAASCIAAAGLSPLVFLVHGHAFPGAWLTPANALSPTGQYMNSQTRPSVIDNPNDLQMMVSKGMITSFESTMICRTLAKPFAQALDRHRDFSEGSGVSEFEGFVDIERATETGIRQLPNRRVVSNSELYDVEVDRSVLDVQRPDSYDIADLSTDTSSTGERLNDGDIPKRVRRWMDALLNIENSNPLVNLVSSPAFVPEKSRQSRRSIEIPVVPGQLAIIENRLLNGESLKAVCTHRIPSQILNNYSEAQLLQLTESQGTLPIAPIPNMLQFVDEVSTLLRKEGATPQSATGGALALFESEHEKEAARRFRLLKKLADDTEAESATNQLFITIGSLVWESPADGTRSAKVVKSPLFIIPVRLSGTAQTSFRIVMDEGGEISPNYCLVEKLRSELGLVIRELESPNLDESGIDVNHTIATIRRQLSDSKFASVRVEEDCNLAVLDFATFRMWKDIKNNWRLFAKNVVVDHLINGSNATLIEEHTPLEHEPLTPFDCDESQLQAVKWALEQRSFVLEGPPGTGKSQTIANMIAAGMAEGKRILFVAEKQVALDAVARKLEEIGLDPFCITMHHESTTPDSIRSQLQTALEFVGQDVKSQWESESAVVTALQQRLNQYRNSLISGNELGDTAIKATREVARLGKGSALEIDPSTLSLLGPVLSQVRSALLQLRLVVGSSFVTKSPEWALCSIDNSDDLDNGNLNQTIGRLQEILRLNQDLRPLLESILTIENTSQDGSILFSLLDLLVEGGAPSLETAQTVVEPHWIESINALHAEAERTTALHRSVLDFFTKDAFLVDLTPQLTAATEAMSAGFLGRKKKIETLKSLLTPLTKVTLTQEPAEILTLLQRIAPARDAFLGLTTKFREVKYLNVRSDFDPNNSLHLEEIARNAHEVLERSRALLAPEAGGVQQVIKSRGAVSQQDVEALKEIQTLWRDLVDQLKITNETLAEWKGNRSIDSALYEDLPLWLADSPSFAKLSKHILIKETLAPLIKAGQHQLVASVIAGEKNIDDIHDEFERGIALSSQNDRMTTGVLSGFNKSIFDKTVADFNRRYAARRELMKTVIPRELADSRPFKPGIRTGAIGNLERELGRKVRRVSVPKLIQEHGEMITRLAPCFLMSPEAVSRLLPADSQFFDLVIFDEASQIRVAAAIPAMGRGKSVIVVGDSQQMPPSKKIGQRQASTDSSGEADDDDIVEDLESILTECTESNLPSLMLQCHFRSQHEGLIAFSNRSFYDGRLVTFPAPNTDRSTPISWIDVPDGQFHRKDDQKGTNPQEAKQVVAEIGRRLNSSEHGSKSIGVVTFNEKQADLISELLQELAATDKAVSDALNHPRKSERLFVVPLEKVQGDERDTIMLSVSYSYQGGVRNKVSPTWGPLTNKGGERRLNVAITRAKKDLIIFCSFDPNHVSTENSTYDGVKATVAFLKECRDASISNGAALKARDVTNLDRLRRNLMEQLRAEGINVRENVGLSRFRIDLAVTDESTGEQFLALLLDGEEWASRETPFDREILPNSVLRLIGWRRIGRIWLKSLVEDPDQIIREVRNEVAREKQRALLKASLIAKGYEVKDDAVLSRIGIDLAIRKPGQSQWPLAIAINAPDTFPQFFLYEGDVPRGEILAEVSCVESLSVWLSDIITDIEKVNDRIEQAYSNACDQITTDSSTPNTEWETPASRSSFSSVNEQQAKIPVGPALIQSPHWSEFTDARDLTPIGDASILGPGPAYNPATVRNAVAEIVETEGPIIQSRLASILVGRFGMSKVTASRLKSLINLFDQIQTSETSFGTVYWPSNLSVDTWEGFRTSLGEPTRPIDDVPIEELSNAMKAVLKMGDSATGDEIIRMVASVYGRRTVTQTLRDFLEAILSWNVEQGKILFDGTFYKLP